MKGEFACPVRSAQHVSGLLLQRFRDSAVQTRPLRWEQVGVDNFTEERVPEPVGVAGAVDDE